MFIISACQMLNSFGNPLLTHQFDGGLGSSMSHSLIDCLVMMEVARFCKVRVSV